MQDIFKAKCKIQNLEAMFYFDSIVWHKVGLNIGISLCREGNGKREQRAIRWPWTWSLECRGRTPKGVGSYGKSEEVEQQIFLWILTREQRPANTFILDIGTPELWVNKCLLA